MVEQLVRLQVLGGQLSHALRPACRQDDLVAEVPPPQHLLLNAGQHVSFREPVRAIHLQDAAVDVKEDRTISKLCHPLAVFNLGQCRCNLAQ